MAILNKPEKRSDQWSQLLIAVGKDRDRQAFAELFEHFGPLLKGFAHASRSEGWFPGLGDDLVQEVMIKVWNKAAGYNAEKASATTWIYTVARNCRIDMLRRKVIPSTCRWRMKTFGTSRMKRLRSPCSSKSAVKKRSRHPWPSFQKSRTRYYARFTLKVNPMLKPLQNLAFPGHS